MNLRPSGPKPDALPGCATLRRLYYYSTYEKFKSIKISKIREILKEYDIKKKEILNMKIEHGYHAVIFCKEDDEITLWDTQQVLFNGKNSRPQNRIICLN